MNNIYEAWKDFSQEQKSILKSQDGQNHLAYFEKKAAEWSKLSYPQSEDWKYVKFGQLPATALGWPSANSEKNQVVNTQDSLKIEIQNVACLADLSIGQLPEGLKLYTEAQFIEDFGYDSLKEHQVESSISNPFVETAASFVGQGLVLVVEQGATLEKPIRFSFDFSKLNGKDLYSHVNLTVVAKAASKASVFIESDSRGYTGAVNLCIWASLALNSEVSIYNYEKSGKQTHFFYNFTSRLQEAARLLHLDVTAPSFWSRHNVESHLCGKAALSDLKGLYFNCDKNFVDHHTAIYHHVGETESKEDYRGILSDQSQAVFNGKVYIAPGASKSNSEQINKNLMLSSKAEVDTKPELQIYNDDVKAAHGATVGQLDEEQRFYLQSRGYTSEMAAKILARAFVFDLLEEVPQANKELSREVVSILEQLKES